MTLPFQFQPTIDTDYSQVNVEMVPGSTLEQTGAVTQHVADVLSQSRIVDSAFSDIEPTKATIYLTLKKGHEQSSVDWEREMAHKLQAIANERVNFQWKEGGGCGREGTIMLGSVHPELARQTAPPTVQELEDKKENRPH